MFQVKFIRNFEGHKLGELAVMTASQVYSMQEWGAIEVLQNLDDVPAPKPVAPKAKPAKGKK
jgi:hypothetical protein